ncbi:Uncharacterized protein SAPIO_CDS3231 [Scedosporium apiospermum]|uniref:Peptidase S54 rhomboid domain-containing protein n=1 Tax=Pseudallescheria apiosperma TaxID=563466 RepID=A0A084GAB7_PSEDA|nr:Uncharacterized protein SAPIO_CDS3231 [Scedosporium apiospermum]KEZ44279.1 Uncharacterized protein SAPIO_CDS3231 [Scedosporium apiospermum]
MSLLGFSSPKLCLRIALSTRVIPRQAISSSSPKPPKRPGFLERVKWYKEDSASPSGTRRPAVTEILTMYEELPPTYRDRDGLPFSKKDLTPAEVARIFGTKLKPEFANTLLRILHGRRVAGTLDDPAYKANTACFTKKQQETALEYLRQKIPVDETMNSGLRAQDELEQLEKEMAGLKEPSEEAASNKEAPTSVAGEPETTSASPKDDELEINYKPDPVYGHSAIDLIRAKNQARIKAEEKRMEEEKKVKGEPVAGTLEAYVERGAVSPRMQKWMEEGTSGIEEAPELSTWDRLAPSITFAILFVGSCIGFAMIYNPPEPKDRVFPEFSAGAVTVATLIGLNLAVWSLWKIPPLWRLLNNYFMLVVAMPRPVTLVTSMFSHQKLSHLGLNMAMLYYIGNRLHDEIGRANFLALYLSSGVIGYVASLCVHGASVASLGASGAVLGITAAYFWLHLWDKFRIMGFPAEPSEGVDGVAFLISVLLWNLIAAFAPSKAAQADLASHMGGLLSGIGLVHVLQNVAKTISADDAEDKDEGPNGVQGKDAGTYVVPSVSPDAGVDAPSPSQQHAPGQERRSKSFDLWGTKHGGS